MQHTLEHFLGLTHLVVALLAIIIGVNLTAFLIYELFGGLGLFHWMALVSLLTVLMGYVSARSRSPGWKVRHAYFMSGSYVGLIAALAAEVLTRTSWLPFYGAVAVASFTVFFLGLVLMFALFLVHSDICYSSQYEDCCRWKESGGIA